MGRRGGARSPRRVRVHLDLMTGCCSLTEASSRAPRVTRSWSDVLPALSSDLRVSPHLSDFHLRCGPETPAFQSCLAGAVCRPESFSGRVAPPASPRLRTAGTLALRFKRRIQLWHPLYGTSRRPARPSLVRYSVSSRTGHRGGRTRCAVSSRPRWTTVTSSPSSSRASASTKPSPMPRSRMGEKLPLVRMPTRSRRAQTSEPSRNGWRPVGHEAPEAAGGAVGPLLFERGPTGELLLVPADHPAQPGLERGDAGAQLVAVQGQSRLEAQRVAGTQPGRGDALGQDGLPEVLRHLGRARRTRRRPRPCSRCRRPGRSPRPIRTARR